MYKLGPGWPIVPVIKRLGVFMIEVFDTDAKIFCVIKALLT